MGNDILVDMASVLNVSDTTVAFDNTSSVRYISLPVPPDMVLEDDTTVAFDNTSSVRYISLPVPPDMVLEDDTTVAFDNTSSVRYISLPAPPDTVLEDDVPLVLSIEGPLPYSVAIELRSH